MLKTTLLLLAALLLSASEIRVQILGSGGHKISTRSESRLQESFSIIAKRYGGTTKIAEDMAQFTP